MSLEELQKNIKDKEQELSLLRKKLEEYPNVVLMGRVCKGKHTFVLQPVRQIRNLEANGWRKCDPMTIASIKLALNKELT